MMKTGLISILMQLILLASTLLAAPVMAQNFSVASFRDLPNDVSAFINPVRDLNDEDCALLKTVGPTDFVFSTPLGIVKREDKTGEIWLYLPHGSRKITIKHAEWGVLRDYEFPAKLESHKTYEMTLKYPQILPPVSSYGEATEGFARDTLVVTRVDTLIIKPIKKNVPLEFNLLANFGFGGKAPYSFGTLMLSLMKRHGGYLRISSLPSPTDDPIATCDRDGLVDGQERFYSGVTSKRLFMVSGGAIHRLSGKWTIFEGLGYGETSLDWQLAPSEGGGYVRNSWFSAKGVTAEAGVQFRWDCVVFAISVSTLKGTQWFGSIGAGFRFGKGVKWPSFNW